MSQILIVQDSLDNAEPLFTRLKGAGYQTVICDDGNHAVKFIHQHQPDLVLLDLIKYSPNIFEVCNDIRQSSNLPIIMMSATAGNKERIKGFSLGVDDFVNKPFSLPELLLRIKSVLKRSR